MPNSVVIIIDVLNDFFCGERLAEIRPQLCESINELVTRAREKDLPVIWVRQEFHPDLSDAFKEMRQKNISITIAGTEGCEFLPELMIDPQDEVVIKKRYSAFFGTNLEELLEDLGAEQLILAGINTHACVRMAAIDAYQRDYDVLIVRECVGSHNRQHHEISLEYLDGGIAEVVPMESVFD